MELYRQKFQEKLQSIADVKLNCIPLHYQYHNDHDYEMPILVQVLSGKLPHDYPRKPIDLCIVLDRSGSMSKSIESCKEAIYCLINNLTKNDKMHLVIYDDKIDVVFKDKMHTDKDFMINKVKSIVPRGSTDLYGGIKKGIDILLGKDNVPKSSGLLQNISNYFSGTSEEFSNNEPKIEDKSQILFLFSDGMANIGITNGDDIGKKILKDCEGTNIMISTFGIGSHYDEILMSSIAFCGNGNYFYINDIKTIPKIIEMGLDGLTRYWSTDAKLQYDNDNVVVVDDSDLVTSFKIREYALNRNIIKVKCFNDIGKMRFTLSYKGYDGIEHVKEVECEWYYNNENKSLPDKQVLCYMIIKECSNINTEIMELMDKKDLENDKLVKEKKEKIIELYKSIVDDDEYGIIKALLEKEENALFEMKTHGIYSSRATKSTLGTNHATGNKTKMYKYTNESSKSSVKLDGDIGYTSFM